MRKKTCGIPSIGNSRLSVYPVLAVIVLCLVFASGAWPQGTLLSGSLSTPILYDTTADGIQPQSARTPVANVPGGLVATAAWYDFGMKLSWDVIDNGNGTYTYHYLFGPGWYPATNPTSGSSLDPYVTNKNITAFDIQLGSTMTLGSLSNVTWNVYDFANTKLGYGGINSDGSQYWTQINPNGNGIDYSGTEATLTVKSLTGETGWKDTTVTPNISHYMTNTLFHGLQWVNISDPNNVGNTLFPTGSDVNFELTFTTIFAPGWGNFFTNSTRTGANNNYSDVVAYNSSDTSYVYNKLDIPVHYNDSVAIPGGLIDVTPPTVDSTYPAGDASDVPIGRSVTVTFSELLDPSTATGANFTLSDAGGQVSGTVSFNSSTKILTFTPQTPLMSGTDYTAALIDGIKDLHGNSLASAQNWSFTTKAYDIADALRTLHIAVGLITPDANDSVLYDVAPLVAGKPASNGTINVLDVLVILRRVVGANIW